MSIPTVGLRSFGVYIPETYLDKKELAALSGLPEAVIEEKLGFVRKPIPGPDDHCSTMAAAAARQALSRAGLDGQDIDLVIWTGGEYKDYPFSSPGIQLAYDLGCGRAYAFDISLHCGTMIMGFKLARDMLAADPSLKRVLLAGGYRNGDLIDYANPRVRFLYNLGAGGGAAVLERDCEHNLLLGSAFRIDGSLSHAVASPAGGTVEPLTPEAAAANRHYLDVLQPEWMKERLGQVSMDHFFGVVDDALARSGLGRQDIGYLAVLHMKRSAHELIVNTLGLRPEQSIYLEEYGHIGQNDQLLSLDLALRQGRVTDGTVVVFVSAGIGYAWNAAVIRWGRRGN